MEVVEIPAALAETFLDGGKPNAFEFNGILITRDAVTPDAPETRNTLVDLQATLTRAANEAISADREHKFMATAFKGADE